MYGIKALDFSIWISLISAVIGGLLVIAGQIASEVYKEKSHNRKVLSEVFAEVLKQQQLLRDLYRELAMYKTHAEYWWYAHTLDSSPDDYKEHLKSQENSRIVEKEIGFTIANLVSLIVKFEYLGRYSLSIDSELLAIKEFKTKSATPYQKELEFNKVRRELVQSDEKDLRESYWQNLKNIDEIITKMKAHAH